METWLWDDNSARSLKIFIYKREVPEIRGTGNPDEKKSG